MSTAYDSPPEKHPERVPPNRTNPKRTLVLWLITIILFVVFYNVFRPAESPPAFDEPIPTAPSGPLWPLAIPFATLTVLISLFVRIRSRLPPKYRTGELRTLKPDAPAVEPTAPPFAPIELKGKGLDRPGVLRIDESGFHWSAEARLLQKEQWLDIEWEDLKGFTVNLTNNASATISLWLLIIFVFIAFYSLFSPSSQPPGFATYATMVGVIALSLLVRFVGKKFQSGTMTLLTETHQLTFESRQLNEPTRDQLIMIVKARRPELVPTTTSGGWQAIHLLFIQPMMELRLLFRSDAALMALVRSKSPTTIDDETAFAGAMQHKLYAVWASGWSALMPASLGATWAFYSGSTWSFFVGFFFAWIVGLMLSLRLMKTFARLSGMSVIGT